MSESRFDEVLREAYSLGNGPARVALFQEAIRLADESNDVAAGFNTRLKLIDAASDSGQREVSLVAFSWCLAQSDQNPDRFPISRLIWQYKWILASITSFPQVSRDQIMKMLDDYHRRLVENGYKLRAVHYMRWQSLMEMGNMDEAISHWEAWKDAPQGWPSDCSACECNNEMRLKLSMREDEQALKTAAPILAGKLSCKSVPHSTLAHVLAPLVRVGRLDDALTYHRRGYRMVVRQDRFLAACANHLCYLLHTRNLRKAITIFETQLPRAITSFEADSQAQFYLVSGLLVDALSQTRKGLPSLRLPPRFPLYQEDGDYEAETLRDWFSSQSAQLAGRLDTRNGNDAFSRGLEGVRMLATSRS